jgi:quinoprotein glucose dehydrogenase
MSATAQIEFIGNFEASVNKPAPGESPSLLPTRQTARRRGFLRTAFAILSTSLVVNCFSADKDWPVAGGEPGGSRYSSLTQINRANVAGLSLAWTYHTGDAKQDSTIECTPIVIDGTMFLTTARTRVVALDAENGCERWTFDPYEGGRITQHRASGGVNRGLAYWSEGRKARILVGAPDARLISLDAKTGRPDPAFGKGGSVNLREGMEGNLDGLNYGPTSAPAIYRDIVILGFSCPEDGRPAPGDPRAFDVRTGKELWRFHTIPWPGEFGHETWEGDSWDAGTWQHAGSANNWGGTTLDTKHGLVFLGTGSASPDFYGACRRGDDLFANCVICLDARTGKRVWHFQTLRHDVWDHDLPTPPNVVTVTHSGRKVEAVAQVTKTGYLYLFERRTGRPLFPIEEKSVPASDVPGERTAATQPVPVKPPPFSRQSVSEADLTDISPEIHAQVLAQFRTYCSGSPFTPPTLRGTIVAPGLHGGATWSGASFDPTTGLLYVNSNDQPNVIKLSERQSDGAERYRATGYIQFLDGHGHPAIKPPWGLLNAIDLNQGEFLWRVPLGDYPDLAARGITHTGTENFGGTIVTAGGLVFIGGSQDEMFHAFDKATGKLLWQSKLDAGGYATPCTYMVKGRQFVAIAAGGGGMLGTKSGDTFVAFALPVKR